MPTTKIKSINIQTTERALADRSITLEDLRNAVGNLGRIFGIKYSRFFPHKIRTEHIDRILYVSSTLTSIENLKGFKRHIKEYSKLNVEDHLFTARVANWLTVQGTVVELEPHESERGGKRPDLGCRDSVGVQVFIECKRIRTEKFYDLDEKKRIADLMYEKVQTCDQITVYLHDNLAVKLLEQRLEDQAFVSEIQKQGLMSADSLIEEKGSFSISIIRKPTITGAEDGFVTATIGMFLEDNNDGERMPGYTFLKGGRSVGVFGPPPDYSRIWNRKRSKSKKQKVPNYPFVVVICGEDVLGNPESHKNFFERVWLTSENAECSGVGILNLTTLDGNPQFEYFENPKAIHAQSVKFFEGMGVYSKDECSQ